MNSADIIGYATAEGPTCLNCIGDIEPDENPAYLVQDLPNIGEDTACVRCWEFLSDPDPATYTNDYIEEALKHYLVCAAWSEDAPDLPWDKDSVDSARKELADFWITCRLFLGHWTAEQMGHDFWLTRNGHGTGFWDRGFPQGTELTEQCKPYGSAYVEVWNTGDENVLAIF